MALSAASSQQKMTRTDWKKEKELEEARKAGTAPALQDETGKYVYRLKFLFTCQKANHLASFYVRINFCDCEYLTVFFYFKHSISSSTNLYLIIYEFYEAFQIKKYIT